MHGSVASYNGLSDQDIVIERERRRRRATAQSSAPAMSRWLDGHGVYVNAETGRLYAPHHADEARFVADDSPRYMLAKGGEGGGKSVAGIIKGLEKLRRGMHGIMVSPDLEHFKKSLWPEWRRWCPWGSVVASQQRRQRAEWEPTRPFMMVFTNGATLLCGGIEDEGSWEGPNAHFFHFDEARRKKTPAALKVLDGRIRLVGPQGERPQGFITTTPRKHWLFEYFGPLLKDKPDPYESFKRDSLVVDLLTRDNLANLDAGYLAARSQSLTEAEIRVLLEAAWEDIDDVDRYLPSMTLWDACREALPPLGPREPLVLAADGAVSNDSFGLVGVSRHPERHADVAVRYVQAWRPVAGLIDFAPIETEIERLCRSYNVVQVPYDPYQLHQMMTGMLSRGTAWCDPFEQGRERLEGDKQLYDLIIGKRLAHDGHADLRSHIDNADRKVDSETRKVRIVKRAPGLKVDLAVALAMAAKRCLDLNL